MKARIVDWMDPKPSYRAIYAERNELLTGLRAGGQRAWEAAFRHYADNPIDAIEDWIVTYDPRKTKGPKYMPFILMPKQQDMIRWMQGLLEGQKEGLMEKSRETGASWTALAFAWWLWMFHPDSKIGLGSEIERKVDRKDDPDCLFEKLRSMIRLLPREMQPLGYDEKIHSPFLKLVNPENGSRITGEAGKSIGRGGRSTMYIIDEAAFLENPNSVDAALSENTEVKIWISTPNGTGNPFFRKRFGGHISVFTFHWTDDMRKDEVWYERKKKLLEPEVLAAEIDLDYESSGAAPVIRAQWVRASQDLRRWLAAREMLPEVIHGDGIGGLDVADEGDNDSVFIARFGSLVEETIAWNDGDTYDTADYANQCALDSGCYVLKYDSIGVGAGVTARLNRISDVQIVPVHVGTKPTRTRWEDKKRAKDKFANLKAELWWTVREKLRCAYELWKYLNGEGGFKHELDDVLLLPNDSKLATELALPRWSKKENGKIQIESKKQMSARGIKSPDRAESLILTFGPIRTKAGPSRTVGYY